MSSSLVSTCSYWTAQNGVHKPQFLHQGKGRTFSVCISDSDTQHCAGPLQSQKHTAKMTSGDLHSLFAAIIHTLEDYGHKSVVWKILFLNALHLRLPHTIIHRARLSSSSWPCELSWNQPRAWTYFSRRHRGCRLRQPWFQSWLYHPLALWP